MELDRDNDRTAYFSDGTSVVFPEGTTFSNENMGPNKMAIRVQPKARKGADGKDFIPPSFVLIQHASKPTVLAGLDRCIKGV